MADIRIEFEWIDPLGASGAELRATWARLRVLIDEIPATRVLDERVKTVREDVYVPAYPLAEWFATSWWLLWSELPNAGKTGMEEYWERHSLATAREGYALPPLVFEPLGEFVCVRWARESLDKQAIEFVSEGRRFVRTEACKREIARFIDAVVARLSEAGVQGTLLQEEWSTIGQQAVEEREYCEAAAGLGIDPYAMALPERENLVEISGRLPKAVWGDFFAIARADTLDRDADEVLRALEQARANSSKLPSLLQLRQFELPRATMSPPWNEGFVMARRLREHLGLGLNPLPNQEALGAALGADAGNLNRAIERVEGTHPFFDGLIGTNSAGSPTFVLGHRSENGRRFHLCRGLLEYMLGTNGSAALLTKTTSDRQRRSRAFAAEFLAPADALRDRVGGQIVEDEDLSLLAREFGVSSYVVAHQLENHGIATVVDG